MDDILDVAFYLRAYPDIAAAGCDPLDHYTNHGVHEGRLSHAPDLDVDWYLKTYPDVAASEHDPMYHYVTYGMKEGRRPRAPDPAIVRMFMSMQSLGENCEFGLVQRSWFAEPISLLRWAATSTSDLITLLETGFAGVGAPENTRIVDVDGEWFSNDLRFNLGTHTHIPATTPHDKVYKETCDRLAFLARSQVEDLRAARHVFIRHAVEPTAPDDVRRIHKLVRGYGPATLLMVCMSDEREPGSVEVLDDGLLMGFLDRLGSLNVNGSAHWRHSSHWLAMCSEASRIAQAGRTS